MRWLQKPVYKTWNPITRSKKESSMTHPDFDPEYVFTHHHATPEKLAHYDAIHAGAKRFAEIILAHTPPSTDQTTALRLLRESAMIACSAIALDGRWK
jgi:hypothetical protein